MSGPTEKPTRSSRESLSEYLIVLALLVLAGVGAAAVFGQDIREIFGLSGPARAAEHAPAPETPPGP